VRIHQAEAEVVAARSPLPNAIRSGRYESRANYELASAKNTGSQNLLVKIEQPTAIMSILA
jgi:hypothetical protein